MKDFFVSYTGVDSKWAEWIAFILEEEGFTTILQAWDFRPGTNFVLEMHDAASTADRTIMVLSPDYLRSGMAASEWASAFAADPRRLERKLLPIMVRDCKPSGLLGPIVQVRIMGMEEGAARAAILAGAKRVRAKPSDRPVFPGMASARAPKQFPGSAAQSSQPDRTLLPKLRVPLTDVDRRRFSKSAFGTIRAVFGGNLKQVAKENDRLEFDLTDTTTTDFRAELFLDGASRGRCRIWLGGMMNDNNICFGDGQIPGDACTEILMQAEDNDELRLSATMAMGYSDFEKGLDLKKLSAEQAGHYLWERFTRAFRSR